MRGFLRAVVRFFRRWVLRRSPSSPTIRPLPKHLTHFYRYGSAQHLDRLEPVILRHFVYAPTAKELNDPKEAKPQFADIPHERIAAFLNRMYVNLNPGLPPERYANAAREVATMCQQLTTSQILNEMSATFYAITENTRILSMSKRWDHMAMWAKYADNHRGYCLEFAKAGLFNAAREVIYDDSFRLDVGDPSHATHEWFFCKSTEWSNEEEVRIVLARRLGGPWFPIEPSSFTRIILGKDMSDADRKKIRAWAAARVPPLTVVTAQYDGFTHRLKLVP